MSPALVLSAAAAGWPYLVAGFACGSIPFGLLVSRVFFKRDIRSEGSGNIGAANALRTMGAKAGLAVLALDAAKGALPVALATHLAFRPFSPADASFGPSPSVVALVLPPLVALAAVLGHCYSPWLGFRGGKGVATYLGALIALAWPAAALFGVVWIATFVPTKYASAASLLGTLGASLYVAFGSVRSADGGVGVLFAVATLAVIVWRHRENLARLRAGTESKLDLARRVRREA